MIDETNETLSAADPPDLQQGVDVLPPEVRAAAMHVALSEPESRMGWFPMVALFYTTLVAGGCFSIAAWLVDWNLHFGSAVAVPFVFLACCVMFVGQFALIPLAFYRMHRNPSLRTVENMALFVGAEVVYLMFGIDLFF